MKLSLRQTADRRPFILCLLGILLVFAVINVRWLWVYRHGQPIDIDEAAYLNAALADYVGLKHGGLQGFLHALAIPSANAPLIPTLAAVLFWIVGPHMIAGFALPLAAGIAIIAATYFLGTLLGSRAIGLMSAALVASCPMIVTFARAFQFALPATFCATMALAALLRSDRCRHWGWALVFGVCTGLMPLARTMTIAFVPGLVAAAVIATLIDPVDRRRRFLILAWALMFAAAVALLWLGPNGRYVFHYLLSYGYGSNAADYGPPNPEFSIADWVFMTHVFVAYVFVPHFVIVASGALCLLVMTGRRVLQDGPRTVLQTVMFSTALPIVVFVAEAVMALTSSQNKGDGFYAPIVPAAIVLATWALCRISNNGSYRFAFAGLVAGVAVFATVPSIDLGWSGARPWQIDLPILGPSPVSDGRGHIQRYEDVAGFVGDSPTEPIPPTEGRAWVDLNATVAAAILKTGGVAAFGFRHYLFNVLTIQQQEIIQADVSTALLQVDLNATGDSLAGNMTWLTEGDAAQACLLLTSDDEKTQFPPPIDQGRMFAAATQVGFQPVKQWVMPRGHTLTAWVRPTGTPPCQTAAFNPGGESAGGANH